jgi:hypothetical protein
LALGIPEQFIHLQPQQATSNIMKKPFELVTLANVGIAREAPIKDTDDVAHASGPGAKKRGYLKVPFRYLAVAALLHASIAAAQQQSAVVLGSAASAAVLSGTTVTNTGLTIINGNLGVWPGTAISGFGPGVVNGTVHAGDLAAQYAQGSLTIAYNDAAARTSTAIVALAGDISGLTLAPGLFKSTSSLSLSGTVTLHGRGVYIFQIASGLTVGNGGTVVLSGGATSDKVFWQVGSSATLGTTADFKGTILALTSISLDTGATLDGRALAEHGAVTLNANDVTVPAQSYTADTYNPSNKQLTIPSLSIGNQNYFDVVVGIGHLISGPSGSTPIGAEDSYNPGNGQITIPAVMQGSSTFYNVVATVTGLVSIGSASGVDTYNAANQQLSIPAVQVLGGAIHRNVVITVAGIVSVNGGMPTSAQDQYTPATGRLFIPAVQAFGKVYTNVVIAVGTVVSMGP